MYSTCPTEYLNWEYRKQKLLEEILSYEADIICIQEMTSFDLEDFFGPKFMEKGYKYDYAAKVGGDFDGHHHHLLSCVTFYSDKFTLLQSQKVDFVDKARLFMQEHGIDESKGRRYMRDTAGLLTVMQYQIKKRNLFKLCVANVHLIANVQLGDVKLLQTYLILQELEKLGEPALLTGDFNFTPKSDPYILVTEGRLPQDSTDPNMSNIIKLLTKQLNIKLGSAYKALLQPRRALASTLMDLDTQEPRYTTSHKEGSGTSFKGTLDYIFYTETKFQVCGLLELLDLGQEGYLPTREWPSDHIALMASMKANK